MTTSNQPSWFVPTLEQLLERRSLSAEQMTAFLEALLCGQCGEVETAALLVALRMKGETAEELAAAAQVMRRHCRSLDLGHSEVLDTCGTGGDGLGTFNISTATALVIAAAGVPVVKHGNRAVSSKSGSADVLEQLGVRVSGDRETALRCLEHAGMAFCLAPVYHPSLQHVGVVRRKLGVRTLFNCLGPLANPAGAGYQLLGVGRPEWLDRMAEALARLGTKRALLVHGTDGLDEVSLTGATLVRWVEGGQVRSEQWSPEEFGLRPCALEELRVADAAGSAAVIREILNGKDCPASRVVLANAAAGLRVVGRVASLPEGVALAREVLYSGRALDVLHRLIEQSH
jgi:anthranilate phosphoribosyltransferase